MSQTAARRSSAKLLTPLLAVALIAIVVVFDPVGELARSLGLGSLPLPDLPGWIVWIRDLPGPGLLLVIVVLVVLGEWGRREKDADGAEDPR